MLQIKFAAALVMPLALFCSAAGAQELPVNCPKPTYAAPPNDVYGPYVPYTGPKQTGCETPKPQPTGQQPDSIANSITSPQLNLVQPATADPAPATPATAESTSEYVRPVPLSRAPTIPIDIRPFHSIAIGFKADTLGVGIELATPLAYRINLRSSYNIFAFNDPFSIDNINYDARLHFKSSETVVDWFPLGTSFHVSPGILYFKNNLSAGTFVGPGQSFTLGTQTFMNSVDDPVKGSASVIYPRNFAPLLLLGFGNLIPRHGGHLSFPVEFGVAYTGAPQISLALSGTACTSSTCATFADSAASQTNLKQEVHDLNEDLKRYPVFPIVSIGVAYHF